MGIRNLFDAKSRTALCVAEETDCHNQSADWFRNDEALLKEFINGLKPVAQFLPFGEKPV